MKRIRLRKLTEKRMDGADEDVGKALRDHIRNGVVVVVVVGKEVLELGMLLNQL